MWFELVQSCGLRVVFEWLYGSDLGSYVVQTGSVGIYLYIYIYMEYPRVVNLWIYWSHPVHALELNFFIQLD